MLVLSSVANREAHPSPRFCVLGMLRERGHTQGFTLRPKFTYWESLTPEPLLTLLLSGSRTVIPQRFEQGLIHDIQFATLPCSAVGSPSGGVHHYDYENPCTLPGQFTSPPLVHLIKDYSPPYQSIPLHN